MRKQFSERSIYDNDLKQLNRDIIRDTEQKNQLRSKILSSINQMEEKTKIQIGFKYVSSIGVFIVILFFGYQLLSSNFTEHDGTIPVETDNNQTQNDFVLGDPNESEDKENRSDSEYRDEIESLNGQIEYLREQNEYLVSVIRQLIEDLSDEEMLAFSKNQFIYELQINGEPIPNNGQVTIPSGDIEILIVEKGLGHEFLPTEWIEKGMISGNYIDHILNFDTSNWELTGRDGTVNTAQGYLKTDVKSGEQFSFNITDELKERLKINTNLIQIEVQ